jgi:hypothetical protein
VQLAGGSIRMAPSRYFYSSEDADEFCLGIFDNYEDSLVIGESTGPAHTAPAHTGPAHTGPAHTAPAHTGPAHCP